MQNVIPLLKQYFRRSLLELLLLKFQRNYTVEVQVSLLQKSWYSMSGRAGDVLHERAISNKMKNIHCEVQVILLQKSWYIMRGSAVLVMYSMQSASKNKNKNSRADSLFSIAVLSDRGIWNNSKDQYKFFLRCVRISAVLHVQTLIMKNLT